MNAVSSIPPVASAANDTSTSPPQSNSTISASDFMTLLVTEMKNQDPTQPTDPAQYVQQLVGVNSLEQLIGINQGIGEITSALSVTPSAS